MGVSLSSSSLTKRSQSKVIRGSPKSENERVAEHPPYEGEFTLTLPSPIKGRGS